MVLESLVDWLSLAAAFVVVARLVRLRPSPLDALGMTAVARAPFILIALLSGKWAILFSLLALVVVVWTIALLWAAFKESTRAEGRKAAFGVGGSILVAEVVSKLVLAAAR